MIQVPTTMSSTQDDVSDWISPSGESPLEDPARHDDDSKKQNAYPSSVALPTITSAPPPSDVATLIFGKMRSPSLRCSRSSSETSNDCSHHSSTADGVGPSSVGPDRDLQTETSEGDSTVIPSQSLTGVGDAKRRVAEQQLQHTLAELNRCREAYQASLSHAQELHVNLQQVRTEYNTHLHRYSALTERMAGTEKSLSLVETALIRERKGNEKLLSEKEEEKKRVSKLQVEVETLERRLREATAAEEKWRQQAVKWEKDLQNCYVPVGEVKRLREELRTEQRLSITQPLQQLLQNLVLAVDSDETKAIVKRSHVLSSSRELEDELAHTRATITALKEYWTTFHQPLDEETNQFMEKVVKENGELYQQLTELQRSYSVLQTTLEQRLPPGESVPVTQYRRELEQLERRHATRLKKAQELLVAQTNLIHEHEETLEKLLAQVEELKEQLEALQVERDKTLHEKRWLEESLEQSKQEVVCRLDDIKVLQQKLAELQRYQDLDLVPRREREEREEEIQALLKRLQMQQSVQESLEQKQAQTEKLLEVANRQLEVQKREIMVEKEDFTTQRARWEKEAERLRGEHIAALQRVEEDFGNRVAELEKDIVQYRERESEQRASIQRLEMEVAEQQVQERSLECSRRLVEEDREEVRKQLEEIRIQQLAPLEEARASLETKLHQIRSEKEEAILRAGALAQQLNEESKARAEEEEKLRASHDKAVKQLEVVEAARIQLQQHLGKALCKIKDLEIEMDGDRASGLDRSSLLKENQRLQALLKAQTEEAERSHLVVEQQRAHMQLQEELQAQVKELQRQLSCLPPLQEALQTLEGECLAAKTEVASLQLERDATRVRLLSMIQRQEEDALMEEGFNKALRDAQESTKPWVLGGDEGKTTQETRKALFNESKKEKSVSIRPFLKGEENSTARLPLAKSTMREACGGAYRRQPPAFPTAYHYSTASRAALLLGESSGSRVFSLGSSPESMPCFNSSLASCVRGAGTTKQENDNTQRNAETAAANVRSEHSKREKHIETNHTNAACTPTISCPSLDRSVTSATPSVNQAFGEIEDKMDLENGWKKDISDTFFPTMADSSSLICDAFKGCLNKPASRSHSAELRRRTTCQGTPGSRSRSVTIFPLHRQWKA